MAGSGSKNNETTPFYPGTKGQKRNGTQEGSKNEVIPENHLIFLSVVSAFLIFRGTFQLNGWLFLMRKKLPNSSSYKWYHQCPNYALLLLNVGFIVGCMYHLAEEINEHSHGFRLSNTLYLVGLLSKLLITFFVGIFFFVQSEDIKTLTTNILKQLSSQNQDEMIIHDEVSLDQVSCDNQDKKIDEMIRHAFKAFFGGTFLISLMVLSRAIADEIVVINDMEFEQTQNLKTIPKDKLLFVAFVGVTIETVIASSFFYYIIVRMLIQRITEILEKWKNTETLEELTKTLEKYDANYTAKKILELESDISSSLGFMKEFDNIFSFLPLFWLMHIFASAIVTLTYYNGDNITFRGTGLPYQICYCFIFTCNNLVVIAMIVYLWKKQKGLKKLAQELKSSIVTKVSIKESFPVVVLSIIHDLNSIGSFEMTAGYFLPMSPSIMFSTVSVFITVVGAYIRFTSHLEAYPTSE